MSTAKRREPAPDQPTLFELPAGAAPPRDDAAPAGTPRLRRANRHQVVFRAVPLDALIPDDHTARVVWQYVDGLDLAAFYARIDSREGGPGRAAADPKILLALWLYATLEGVGSARELDRLCRDHVAYQWLAGDVTMNYHSLADFRVGCGPLLDELLTAGVAALVHEELVELREVAQDGMRVRASAGAASFRRRPTLDEALRQAEAQVRALRDELEADPAAGDRRRAAARRRAATERAERIGRALGRLPELEAKKRPDEKDRARASTTDPEATVMKMADGGFRPAYNVQFATDAATQVIVGVAVVAAGSDAGQMAPMVEQVRARTGRAPAAVLVDGGFATHGDIDVVSDPAVGCTVYAPVPEPRDPAIDRYAPKPSDSPAVAAWRRRMATAEAKAIYVRRAATAECVNALARGRGLVAVVVRGLAKVRAVALWQALAHNLMRSAALRDASAGVAIAG